jgi:hypothetical protein
MASLQRKKINLDDDPLAFLGGGSAPDREEEQEVQTPPVKTESSSRPVVKETKVNETETLKTISETKVNDTETLKTISDTVKIKKISSSPKPIVEPTSAIADPTSTVTSEKVVAPNTIVPVQLSANIPTSNSKPEDVFSFLSKPSTEDDGENLFAIPVKNTSTKSPVNTKSVAVKYDFNKDDEDISDLNVTKLLEKEDDLDYKLFGKTESVEQQQAKVKSRLNDINREDDFLRELDVLTKKAAVSSKAQTTTKTTTDFDLDFLGTEKKSSSKSTKEIDISSLDLNAYIEQESSSGGGLFDD